MRDPSGGTAADARGRFLFITRTLVLAGIATGSAVLLLALISPAAIRAQGTRAGAENAPHFLRFGKTYVNMAAVSHAVSDPGFGLPPTTLQVYFGGQSYINLYGEDADAFRRVLDAGTIPMTGAKTDSGAAATPGAAAPVSVRKAPAKKSVPRESPR